MFLNKFSLEQKLSFLSIAHYIANVDGKFVDEEKAMLEYYCLEMNLEDELSRLEKNDLPAIMRLNHCSETDISLLNSVAGLGKFTAAGLIGSVLGSALSPFSKSDVSEDSSSFVIDFDLKPHLNLFIDAEAQKILVLELLAIIYSNDEFHIEQKNVLDFIIDYFDMSSYLVTVYTEWAKTMISLQRQGNALIHL